MVKNNELLVNINISELILKFSYCLNRKQKKEKNAYNTIISFLLMQVLQLV